VIADKRAALTAELTLLFGPLIRQLAEAELLYVDMGENSYVQMC
jgi:hypothetical protein